jgi:CBS domain containing-hemolysin-like protein
VYANDMDILTNGIPSVPPILAAGPVGGGDVAGTWGGLILFVAVALGVSFLCSILEAVLLSTSISHIETMANEGKPAGKLMQKHKSYVERPISAILTLNTIAHTVGATGAGAEAVGIFGSEWVGLISAVLTFLILVFSEIIPKTLGATYWRQLTGFAAYLTEFLVIILFPAVWFLEQTTRVLKSQEEGPTVSRDDIEALARLSTSEGTLLAQENRILRNLLHLRNVQIRDIMTPRTVVFTLHQDTTLGEVLQENPSIPYSRIPIYNENIDDIAGFVLRHDVFHNYANGAKDKPLIELKRDIHAVPETNSVANVLDEMMSNGQHIVLVIDEYGGVAGVLTMEDAIESLLGIEITDESDLVADLRKMAQQRHQRQQAMLERMNTIVAANGSNGKQPDMPTLAPDQNTRADDGPANDGHNTNPEASL